MTEDKKRAEFIFSMVDSSLLADLANQRLDIELLVKKEMANRGLDFDGKWIGFKLAEENLIEWDSERLLEAAKDIDLPESVINGEVGTINKWEAEGTITKDFEAQENNEFYSGDIDEDAEADKAFENMDPNEPYELELTGEEKAKFETEQFFKEDNAENDKFNEEVENDYQKCRIMIEELKSMIWSTPGEKASMRQITNCICDEVLSEYNHGSADVEMCGVTMEQYINVAGDILLSLKSILFDELE